MFIRDQVLIEFEVILWEEKLNLVFSSLMTSRSIYKVFNPLSWHVTSKILEKNCWLLSCKQRYGLECFDLWVAWDLLNGCYWPRQVVQIAFNAVASSLEILQLSKSWLGSSFEASRLYPSNSMFKRLINVSFESQLKKVNQADIDIGLELLYNSN